MRESIIELNLNGNEASVIKGVDIGTQYQISYRIDIKQALQYLGEIIGAATTGDLLDNIFSKFCIEQMMDLLK